MTVATAALHERLWFSSWPIVSYMAYAGVYTFIQSFNLFARYKIAESDPSSHQLQHALIRCLQLQFMHSCIEYYFGDDHLYSQQEQENGILPVQWLVRLIMGMIAVDTFQYFFHRMLHTVPWLYKNVHKDHHKYKEPFSFSGLYNSVWESFFADAGCIIFATLACALTANESMLLAAMASAKTVSDHCGYMIPYDPFTFCFPNNAAYHRHHHIAPVTQQGNGRNLVALQQPFFTFWDYWLGTYPDLAIAREEKPPSTRSVKGASPPTAAWDNFARIVCLNLKQRPDRLEHAKSQFAKAGIGDRVEYSIVEKSPKGGCFGCFQSHWNTISKAYKDGLANIAIFEDDVFFREGWQSVINDCNAFVAQEPGDWEYLNMNGPIYLIVEDSKSSETIVNGKTSKTHAICLSRAGMKRFLELYPEPVNVGVDDAYMAQLSKTYCHTNPNVIVQLEDLGTDNPWCFFDNVAGMEAQYKDYIQNIYIPAMDGVLSRVNLLFGLCPYFMRPWLVSQNFSENLQSDIHVFRNGHEETFAWKVSVLGEILVTLIGLAVALKVELPDGMSRVNLIWYLLQI